MSVTALKLNFRMKRTILVIFACLLTISALGQSEILPYLYLEDKNGGVEEIPFTNGTMKIIGNKILIDMPEKPLEYDYDEIESFYFKDKNFLTLLNLTVSEGVLTPEFNSQIFNYIVEVPNNTTSITITGTANNENATVTGNGLKELEIGENIFTITVTAEDVETVRNYTVTVSRQTNIISILNDFGIKIYPNPTEGKFTVHIPNGLNEISLISINNAQGQKIEDRIVTDENTIFDFKKYSTGVYFLNMITNTGQRITTKLIKQ